MEDRGLATDELCDSLFKLEVNRLSSAKEPHRRHAVAPLIEPAMSGSFDARMIREPEIVIRCEHHDFVAVDGHFPALFAFEWDFVLESLCFLDVFKFAIERCIKFVRIHKKPFLLDYSMSLSVH